MDYTEEEFSGWALFAGMMIFGIGLLTTENEPVTPSGVERRSATGWA
jgi:hypothetical protein